MRSHGNVRSTFWKVLTLSLILASPALAGDGIFGLFSEEASSEESGPPDTPWFRISERLRGKLAPVLEKQTLPSYRSEGERGPIAREYYRESYERYQRVRESDPSMSWPRYYFDHHLGIEERRVLLSLQAKLEDEFLWREIDVLLDLRPKGIRPGFRALPINRGTFRKYLKQLGYGDWNGAAPEERWGLRSPKKGAQLHIVGPAQGEDPRGVDFRVDLRNPGKGSRLLKSVVYGPIYNGRQILHALDDGENISERLQTAVREQGIRVEDPDVTVLPGATISDFLKWETDEEDMFGFLWLKPREGKAGYWTEWEGARNFRSVRLVNAGYPVVYELTCEKGSVTISFDWDEIRGSWYPHFQGPPEKFEGEKVRGHVFRRDR